MISIQSVGYTKIYSYFSFQSWLLCQFDEAKLNMRLIVSHCVAFGGEWGIWKRRRLGSYRNRKNSKGGRGWKEWTIHMLSSIPPTGLPNQMAFMCVVHACSNLRQQKITSHKHTMKFIAEMKRIVRDYCLLINRKQKGNLMHDVLSLCFASLIHMPTKFNFCHRQKNTNEWSNDSIYSLMYLWFFFSYRTTRTD